jgi:hypothetical protein
MQPWRPLLARESHSGPLRKSGLVPSMVRDRGDDHAAACNPKTWTGTVGAISAPTPGLFNYSHRSSARHIFTIPRGCVASVGLCPCGVRFTSGCGRSRASWRTAGMCQNRSFGTKHPLRSRCSALIAEDIKCVRHQEIRPRWMLWFFASEAKTKYFRLL